MTHPTHREAITDAMGRLSTAVDGISRQLLDTQEALTITRGASQGFMVERNEFDRQLQECRRQLEDARSDRDEARRMHALAAGNADAFQSELASVVSERDEITVERDRINRDAERHARRAEDAEAEVARLKALLRNEPHVMLGQMTSVIRLVFPLLIGLEELVAPDKRNPESSGLWGNPGEIAYRSIVLLQNVAKLHGLAQQYATHMRETGDNPGDLFSPSEMSNP